MNIGVIGTGYVGLVTGTCLAELGHHVICVDRIGAKIDALNAGRCILYEPGLAELIQKNRRAGRLRFSAELSDAIRHSTVFFIAVGTPQGEGGDADLSFVKAAATDIAAAASRSTVVAMKSTVPVGTGDAIAELFATTAPDKNIAVVSNPEFLREGAAIGDFLRPDRVVLGVADSRARRIMRKVYAPLIEAGATMLETDRRTAELIKYASNAFLAVKISYINEVADLCERIGADARMVATGMGLDPRIGALFLQPGPGYGGSCFPKDTDALLCTARRADAAMHVVHAAARSNIARKRQLAERVEAMTGDLRHKTIAILGLTFKTGTDDIRESPALDLIPALQAKGARIRAYDPQGMMAARELLPNVTFCSDPYDAARDSAGLVLLTEWPCFGTLDLPRLARAMSEPRMLDLRNMYQPDSAVQAGFEYIGVGRGRYQPRTSLKQWALRVMHAEARASLGLDRTGLDRTGVGERRHVAILRGS